MGEDGAVYLHLGQNEIVPYRRIIGIFDLDKCSTSRRTRDYLAAAQREGVVLDVSGDLLSPLWCATTRITIRLYISAS